MKSKHTSRKEYSVTYKIIIEVGEVRGSVGVGEANPNRRLHEEQVGFWQESIENNANIQIFFT